MPGLSGLHGFYCSVEKSSRAAELLAPTAWAGLSQFVSDDVSQFFGQLVDLGFVCAFQGYTD